MPLIEELSISSLRVPFKFKEEDSVTSLDRCVVGLLVFAMYIVCPVLLCDFLNVCSLEEHAVDLKSIEKSLPYLFKVST